MPAAKLLNSLQGPIEGLVFGDNEVVTGTADDETFQVIGANDTINGAGGDDTIRAEGGSDNILNGQGGNDFLRGHAGDRFNGGAGVDDALIDLSSDTAGISADLQNLGLAPGVFFGSVEARNIDRAGIILGSGSDHIFPGSSAVLAVYGGDGSDALAGGANADQLAGGLAADTLHGGDGADKLWGFGPVNFPDYPSIGFNDFDDGSVGDRLFGEGGDDVLSASMGWDVLNGGDGLDTVSYENLDDGGSMDGVTIRLAKRVQETGGSGEDRFVSIENVYGSGNADVLTGSDGDNVINGNRGADTIRGGFGADTLTGGASNDADVFAYRSTSESIISGFDRITDFNFADRLDLRGIDANITRIGNQAFKVVDAFDGHAGQLVCSYDSGADETTVTMDTDGDSTLDCIIVLDGEVADDFFIL